MIRRVIAGWLMLIGPADAVLGQEADPPPSASQPAGEGVSLEEFAGSMPAEWSDTVVLFDTACAVGKHLAAMDKRRDCCPWEPAEAVRKSLAGGEATAVRLDPASRGAYWQALYFAAKAAGRPTEACKAARELINLDNRSAWSWSALYFASMLAGDRGGCDEAIRTMPGLIEGEGAAAAVNNMRASAELIGQSPAFEADLSDGTKLDPATIRGKAAAIHFWSRQIEQDARVFKLVKRLHDSYAGYADFRMFGVNMDSDVHRNIVNQFIVAQGMTWPQHFEGRGDRGLSFKVFRVRFLPSLVVISPGGKVIFSGLPNDPNLDYAIRAGLIEAGKGKMPTSQPQGRPAGRPAQMPARLPAGGGVGPAVRSPPDAAKAEREAEADRLLDLARRFEREGFRDKAMEYYRQILSRFSDTKAGLQARARIAIE